MTLSPAATIVLTRSAERPDRLLQFHRKLPTAARHKMADVMLRDGLIAETAGDYRLGDGSTLIEDVETGMLRTTLAITDEGFRALGLEPPTMSEADFEQELDLQQDAIDAENARTDADMAPQAVADDVVAPGSRHRCRCPRRRACAAHGGASCPNHPAPGGRGGAGSLGRRGQSCCGRHRRPGWPDGGIA